MYTSELGQTTEYHAGLLVSATPLQGNKKAQLLLIASEIGTAKDQTHNRSAIRVGINRDLT